MLTESLNYLDMKDQVLPLLGIDEYESRIGEDYDLITINFSVKSKEVADDLVIWLERGYEFVVDADVSPGEVEDGKYYVFAELNRRSSAAKKIIEILEDLKTLTGLKLSQWSLKIKRDLYKASIETIEQNVVLHPQEYKKEHESELNEWREIAGLNVTKVYDDTDSDIKQIQRQAGII